MLRLLHFSDIHFNKKGGVYDENIEVRDAIEKDLKYLMEVNDTNIDYILVCGDIAFSGKNEEYNKASNWLNTICNIIKCKQSSVLLVPGNHDVDRAIIDDSYLQKMLHINIKNQGKVDLNHTFDDLSKNKHIDILKLPQTNFNDFASKYGCNVKSNDLCWELKHENFRNHQLIFRGCNSAFLSDKEDDSSPFKMALSKQQYYIKDDYRTIYITLCHHPIECLIDKENVETSFNNKVMLQLFGHNHKYHVEKKEKSLIIHAGAVKPEIGDEYNPCYNIIDIDINEENNSSVFSVKIWVREWDGKKIDSGVKDGLDFEIYNIPLNDNENPWLNKVKKAEISDLKSEMIQIINKPIETENGMEDYTERDVRYKFLTLPFRERRRIGNEMIQNSFDESQKSEMDRSLEFLNKIKETNRYQELWDKINS